MTPLPDDQTVYVRVWAGGTVTTAAGSHQPGPRAAMLRGTLALLVAHAGQVIPIDQFTADLWAPTERPDAAVPNVRSYIQWVRRALGPARDRLSTHFGARGGTGGYCLRLAPHESDLGQVDAAVRAADRSWQVGRIIEALAHYGDAARLRPGTGAGLPATPRIQAIARRWRQRHIEVLARYVARAHSVSCGPIVEPYTEALARMGLSPCPVCGDNINALAESELRLHRCPVCGKTVGDSSDPAPEGNRLFAM